MSKQTGALIKEARTAAGLSQKALAEKIEGLSASTLGKAERGEKELTPQQLEAIAAVTGVAYETLIAETPEAKALTDEEIFALYKAADPQTQQAVISMLKGEKPQGGDMMSMFASMMGGAGGEGGDNPMAAMMGGAGGEGGDNPMAGMMSMFSSMMGGAAGEGGEGGENPMAGMMSMFSGMMGGAAGGNAEKAESKEKAATAKKKSTKKSTKKTEKKTTKKTKKK